MPKASRDDMNNDCIDPGRFYGHVLNGIKWTFTKLNQVSHDSSPSSLPANLVERGDNYKA